MKFRKIPVINEAIQWTTIPGHDMEPMPPAPIRLLRKRRTFPILGKLRWQILTLEGWINISPGDWIINDDNGFYPCKPNIFEQTYEPVEG